ncbi:hypothetical protein SAMN05216556_10919 [Aequorivita viscosa]|uniref:Uncharacterized protein n=1 Tax=Aequorivita viscosa TaxID=797419 RepID=A0A1M6FZB2_9FLAO|nr:hypothetical protein SAMN05216556_10919 [Aequorivita viscosa]SHJ03026.1 hypothetical protein SAMN04487908_10896 [Aequorivita viscosa]
MSNKLLILRMLMMEEDVMKKMCLDAVSKMLTLKYCIYENNLKTS